VIAGVIAKLMEQIGRPAKPRSPKAVRNCKLIGDAFQYDDPLEALWLTMVGLVFADGSSIDLNRLSKEARNLYLLELLVREVMNGGFDQYLQNSSGCCFEETKAALVDLGAATMLAFLEKAGNLFPLGVVPKDQALRRQSLQDIPETWLAELDEEFNQLVGCPFDAPSNQFEDPRQLAIAFMKAHAECLVSSRPLYTPL